MRTVVPAVAAWSLLLLSAALVGGQNPKAKIEIAREIDLMGGPGARVQGNVRKPTRITNANELVKAFPEAEWQECIAKQVDFSKEYLLFFAWRGSGQDTLTVQKGRATVPGVEFLYTAGKSEDLRSHYHLFAVEKNLIWQVRRVGESEAESLLRILREFKAVKPAEETREITTEEDLSKCFGETSAERIRNEVNFAREKLLWVSWKGSGSDRLVHRLEPCKGKNTIVLSVETPAPASADLRQHGVLLVLPRDTAWRFER
jgi:hypothetical protein